jgi:hypothetical protein
LSIKLFKQVGHFPKQNRPRLGATISLITNQNEIMTRFSLAIEQVRGRATHGLTAPVFLNDIDLRTVELADQGVHGSRSSSLTPGSPPKR